MSMAVGGDDNAVMADINVTPMVDVMLVLLIIFMVVTPLIMAGFQAQLPEGAHLKARPENEERTTLGIDATGAYFLFRPSNEPDYTVGTLDPGVVSLPVRVSH